MERCYLDVKYAYGALLREVINYSTYERVIEWFSFGYGSPVV